MTDQLSSILKEDYSAWVYWPKAKFDLRIRYLSPEGRERLVKACQRREFDSKTHQRVDTMDEEKFRKKVADLLVGWKGLTARKIKENLRAVKECIKLDEEIPFTPETKMSAILKFDGLFDFILETAKELHLAEEKKEEEEIKN